MFTSQIHMCTVRTHVECLAQRMASIQYCSAALLPLPPQQFLFLLMNSYENLSFIRFDETERADSLA